MSKTRTKRTATDRLGAVLRKRASISRDLADKDAAVALSRLGANLAVAGGLCQAFWNGWGQRSDLGRLRLGIPTVLDPWRPGCGRPAPVAL